jgi:protein-S-isoprenylcysteine O-methyltransferase Ste14
MNIFEVFYWTAVLLEMAIRIPLQKARKTIARSVQRISRTETLLLGLLFITMVLIPLIYTATSWLDFANYHLAGWMGWFGVILLTGALVVFAKAHLDLKSNWSPSLEIYEGHTLVTSGIYKYIRHPMYASQWLWVIAQILLLQNWLAGPIDLILFIPFYILRVRAEEKMMTDQFGEAYRNYKSETGAVIPRI